MLDEHNQEWEFTMNAPCQLSAGDRVRITHGQLEGLTGRIQGSEGTSRALLSLDDYPLSILLAIDTSVLELLVSDTVAMR